jgi:signal transduction histidine kinase
VTRTLRARILTSYVAFAVMVAVVFGFAAAIFLYTAEDRFFEQILAEEAALVEQAWAMSSARPTPRYRWMSVHTDTATMPVDLREAMLAAPRRAEFSGAEGRHYHVRALQVGKTAARAWLVAEVHAQLVLRPRRGSLLANWLAIEAVILATAVALAVLVARRVAKPLSELAASVRALDPTTGMPLHHPATDDQEIAVLASAIDDLQVRVAGFVAREQAFTRDVSHELRTPLAVLRSTVSRLASDTGLIGVARPALIRVLEACDRLEWTVSSLLELARERANTGTPPIIRVRPVLEEVVLELEEPFRVRGLTLEIDLLAGFTLPAEREVLHLVLGNVLGNAWMHSAPGVVRVSCDGPVLVIANPVDAASLPDGLGTRGARREDSPGYGFGLELSRRLCERSACSLKWHTREDTFEVRLG